MSRIITNIKNFAKIAIVAKINNMNRFFTPKVIIFFIFALIVCFIFWLSLSFVDVKVNDFFIKNLTKIQNKTSSNNIVLVVVDDKSVDKIHWPWTRNLFSDIFDFLQNESNAKSIVFENIVSYPDTYFPEKDIEFYQRLKLQNRLINSFTFLNSNKTGDVLPSEFLSVFNSKIKLNIRDERTEFKNTPHQGIINLPKDFLNNVRNLSSATLIEDDDECIRRYMPVVQFNDRLYPSIPLSAFSMFTGIDSFVLNDEYLCSDDGCNSLKMPISYKKGRNYIGNRFEGITTLIRWYTPMNKNYSFKKYSAIDILDSYYAVKNGLKPKISPSEFKDKIVIVGFNPDRAVWEQLSQTSLLDKHSDVDIHATILNNMLDNVFYTDNDNFHTLFITCLFSLFIIRGFKNFRLNLILATLLSFLYLLFYLYEYCINLYVSPIAPIITMYSVAILKKVHEIVTTDKSTEAIKQAMGKFVSNDVLKQIILDFDKLKLGGIRSTVTILFVDIRNFTQISEELSPQEVSSILNEYFSTISPVIGKYNGIVNKYMGDGLLAVFGEPIKDSKHALNAIRCGVELTEKVKVLREKFISEGKPKISIGIGINTGEVFVGNIGTEERLEYTVIGDNVNLAYRIESYNQILKTQFLISEYTYEFVKDNVDVVKLSQVSIKGKSKPIDIYEVLRIKDNDK